MRWDLGDIYHVKHFKTQLLMSASQEPMATTNLIALSLINVYA